MNVYYKYAPNVFLAKCTELHEKGEKIKVSTKYGKENESIIFNLITEKEGFFYYSIVRADDFNVQEWMKKKAIRLQSAALTAEKKSDEYYIKSNKNSEFLSLGEPIKIGHHSEKRHRKIIEQAHNNMGKSIDLSNKSTEYKRKAEYWDQKANTINLSMPECLEFYKFKLEAAKAKHQGFKDGTIERSHSFSLTYAKKEVNDLEGKIKIAYKLWS